MNRSQTTTTDLERPSQEGRLPAFVEMLRLDEIRSAWDDIAVGYDRTNTPSQMSLAHESLRRAGLENDMRFLDVAAGSGALSIPAAQMGARVLATDLSPAMLDLLEARAAGEGLDIETRVMDGHNLDFDDGRFDVTGSQFGVMLFPDLPQALSEMVRVVKPGGRVLVSGYGDPNQIEFLGFFVHAVQSVRPDFNGPPSDPPPLEFQLADPDVFANELSRAGLEDVEVETVKETTRFRSGEELFDWVINSNPIVGAMLRDLDLSDDEQGTIRETLGKMVRKRAGHDETAVLTNPVNVGIGVRR